MRAIVIHDIKDLRIEENSPDEAGPDQLPGPDQVRIRTATGGVCGSDLHYYLHGGFGSVRLSISGVASAITGSRPKR